MEAAGELCPRTGDDHLLHSNAMEGASQQPHLPLPATPLPPGGDVDDRRVHDLGTTSAGQLPLSRTVASGPVSRTTSASRVRSSARLNGLWR